MLTIASSSDDGPDYEPPLYKMKALSPRLYGRLIEPESDQKSAEEIKLERQTIF